ncbi:hypothetical protein AAMO2058_001359500 [Amorphochlora amoebiformis]
MQEAQAMPFLADGDSDTKKLAEASSTDDIGAGGPTLSDVFAHDGMDEEVDIPEEGPDVWFSFKTLWAFTGPGWLMSMAYLDPGNLEADLQQGAYSGYQILWVLFWATVSGWILQVMSATLGVVTGRDLARHCREHFSRPVAITLWIMTELAIIGSDIQEVVGSAIAFNLLLGLPLWAGTLITGLDTFTFLGFHYFGIRKLEAFFCSLIFVMCVCFFVNWGFSGTDPAKFLFGIVVPTAPNYVVLQAVATLGAVVMPHNIYLHSALVLSRRVDRSSPRKIREAVKYNAIESGLALVVSFFINAAIVVTFSRGFFNKECSSLYDTNYACVNRNADIPDNDIFTNTPTPQSCASRFDGNGVCASIGLGTAGTSLEHFLGNAAKYIWGLGLLASGQASTMTGTYAGQFVMSGFLDIQVAPWVRTLLTRTIALGPAIAVAIATANHPALSDQIGEWLNILQSVQLPFALLPVLILTNSETVMGVYKNNRTWKIIGYFLSVIVFGINVYLIVTFCWDKSNPIPQTDWYMYINEKIFLFADILRILNIYIYIYTHIYMYIYIWMANN